MAIRTLVISLALVSALSGCTTDSLVRNFVLPDCVRGSTEKATSHAASCMTVAAYEISQKSDEVAEDGTTSDKDDDDEAKDKQSDPRFEEWIP